MEVMRNIEPQNDFLKKLEAYVIKENNPNI